MWEDLFLQAIKITCSVKQSLNLRDRNIKLVLSITVSVSFNNMPMLKDWNCKTLNTDTLNLDENKLVYKKNYLWRKRFLRDTPIRSMHEMGEMKRAQERIASWSSLSAKNARKWDSTKAHLSVAGNARTDEFYEWFGRISRSGIKLQREIVLRSQSACNDSKFWFHAEQRQTPASWHMEYIGITGKRFWKSIFYVLFTQRLFSKDSSWRRGKKPKSSTWSRKEEDQSHKWAQTKSRHNSNADICNKAVDCEFYKLVEFPRNSMVGPQRQQSSELQFDKFPNPQSFLM